MSALRQRSEPTRSRHYLDGAKGQECTLQITGVCTGGTETNIPAHIRDEHHGRGVKASDLSTCDACMACHDCFDGRTHQPLTTEEWLFYALRALQRTLERRKQQGRLTVRADAPPTRRPAKPKADRAPSRPMQNRPFDSGPSRPISQRQDAWGKARRLARKIEDQPDV